MLYCTVLSCFVDMVPVQFECCGVEGPSDWSTSWWKNNTVATYNSQVRLADFDDDRLMEKQVAQPSQRDRATP